MERDAPELSSLLLLPISNSRIHSQFYIQNDVHHLFRYGYAYLRCRKKGRGVVAQSIALARMPQDQDEEHVEAAQKCTTESVERILQWLHDEGYTIAEKALLKEIEHRCPDRTPRDTSSVPDATADTIVDLSPHARNGSIADSHESVERFVDSSFLTSLSLSLSLFSRLAVSNISSCLHLELLSLSPQSVLACHPFFGLSSTMI